MMKVTHHTPHHLDFKCCVDETATDPITRCLLQGGPAPFEEAWGLSQLVPPQTALLDIGAHIGLFSVLFSAKGHPVYSIEASPQNAALLLENKHINHFHQWHIYNYALSDTAGSLRFVQNGPYGFVETAHTPNQLPCIEVPKIALDSWPTAQEIPADLWIKMDIEGHELQALKGMAHFLQTRRLPPLFIESNGHCLRWAEASPNKLCTLLNSMGYAVYQVIGNCAALRPVSASDLQWEVVCNWLCLNPNYLPANLPPFLPSYTREETIQGVFAAANHALADQRAYLGRALKERPELLAHRAVAGALFLLMHDRDPAVKAAVQWLDHGLGHQVCAHFNKFQQILLKSGLRQLHPRINQLCHRLTGMHYG